MPEAEDQNRREQHPQTGSHRETQLFCIQIGRVGKEEGQWPILWRFQKSHRLFYGVPGIQKSQRQGGYKTGNFVYLVETKNTVLGVQSVLVRLGVTVEERGDGVVRISGALSGQEQIVSASSKPLSAGTEVRIDE